MTKEHRENKRRSRRSVAIYLTVLFFVAVLFLLLAYFMQERAYAQAAAQILSLV